MKFKSDKKIEYENKKILSFFFIKPLSCSGFQCRCTKWLSQDELSQLKYGLNKIKRIAGYIFLAPSFP